MQYKFKRNKKCLAKINEKPTWILICKTEEIIINNKKKEKLLS